MSYSELEEYLAANKDWKHIICSPPVIGYSTMTSKPDNGFRDILREIKKKHVGSTINTF